jgi:hypothetical protein
VTAEEFWTRYPRAFHLTHATNWPTILQHGLLSTERLLDLFEITDDVRDKVLNRRRPESVLIEHPLYGRAIIRDQRPLDESRLARCLTGGISPAQWLRVINRKVFFWVDRKRLIRLGKAAASSQAEQLVLTVDTRRLVTAYEGQMLVSDRNTGTTRPFAHARSFDTFRPLNRNERRPIVELTVDSGIHDIANYLVSHPNR